MQAAKNCLEKRAFPVSSCCLCCSCFRFAIANLLHCLVYEPLLHQFKLICIHCRQLTKSASINIRNRYGRAGASLTLHIKFGNKN